MIYLTGANGLIGKRFQELCNKKITSILDEFQINVNSLSNSHDSAIIYAGNSVANYGDSGIGGMDGGGWL